MEWDAQTVLLIIGAIGAQLAIIITAVFTGLRSLKTQVNEMQKESTLRGVQVTELRAQTAEQTRKIDDTLQHTRVIEGHVNSAATAQLALETSLRKEMSILREQLVEEKGRAALLAQALAVQSASRGTGRAGDAVAVVPVPQIPATTQQLGEIAKNTAATAENTKKE